jgi:hypothetical protein
VTHTALRLLSARETPPVSTSAKSPGRRGAHGRRVTPEPGVVGRLRDAFGGDPES